MRQNGFSTKASEGCVFIFILFRRCAVSLRLNWRRRGCFIYSFPLDHSFSRGCRSFVFVPATPPAVGVSVQCINREEWLSSCSDTSRTIQPFVDTNVCFGQSGCLKKKGIIITIFCMCLLLLTAATHCFAFERGSGFWFGCI